MEKKSKEFSTFKFISSDVAEYVADDGNLNVNSENEAGFKLFTNFINKILDADNLLVLAGSGTSLTFNDHEQTIAPSMWHLWDFCEKNDQDVFNQIKELVKYDQVNVLGESTQDIELLLSLCDSHIGISTFEGDELQLLKSFLAKSKETILDKTNFTDLINGDGWAAHNKFLRTVAIRGPKQQRLKLFTTNYDLAFEHAASNNGLITIDGFDFSEPSYFNPMWYGYDVVKRGSENQSTYLPNVYQLYKMHGSVNWRRNKGRVIKGVDDGEPVFIYPSSTKYQNSYDSPYLDMISAFLNALQQPKTAILCLGFGFNDKHINNALTMALRTNPELMMMVATKDSFSKGINPEIMNVFREAIKHGDGRIAVMDATFDVFSEHLPDRRSKSPEESLLESFENISQKLKIDDVF